MRLFDILFVETTNDKNSHDDSRFHYQKNESTMVFVLPDKFDKENVPLPNLDTVKNTTQPEMLLFVASLFRSTPNNTCEN